MAMGEFSSSPAQGQEISDCLPIGAHRRAGSGGVAARGFKRGSRRRLYSAPIPCLASLPVTTVRRWVASLMWTSSCRPEPSPSGSATATSRSSTSGGATTPPSRPRCTPSKVSGGHGCGTGRKSKHGLGLPGAWTRPAYPDLGGEVATREGGKVPSKHGPGGKNRTTHETTAARYRVAVEDLRSQPAP